MPRSHGIDANPFSCNFPSEAERERIEGALRSRVMHPLSRPANLRRTRRNIHDRAAASFMASRHAPHGFASANHRPDYIHSENLRERRAGNRLNPRKPSSNSSIVHQTGKRSQLAFGGFE